MSRLAGFFGEFSFLGGHPHGMRLYLLRTPFAQSLYTAVVRLNRFGQLRHLANNQRTIDRQRHGVTLRQTAVGRCTRDSLTDSYSRRASCRSILPSPCDSCCRALPKSALLEWDRVSRATCKDDHKKNQDALTMMRHCRSLTV